MSVIIATAITWAPIMHPLVQQHELLEYLLSLDIIHNVLLAHGPLIATTLDNIMLKTKD